MNDRPTPKRVEDASGAIKAAAHFCRRAVFYHDSGIGGVTLHVPDRVLGHREYHDLHISGQTMDRIEARLERGEPCDDLSDLISLELPKRRPSNRSSKRFGRKS